MSQIFTALSFVIIFSHGVNASSNFNENDSIDLFISTKDSYFKYNMKAVAADEKEARALINKFYETTLSKSLMKQIPISGFKKLIKLDRKLNEEITKNLLKKNLK